MGLCILSILVDVFRTSIPPKKTAGAPDYRVYSGGAELGAGWRETSKDEGKEYLALKLDGTRCLF